MSKWVKMIYDANGDVPCWRPDCEGPYMAQVPVDLDPESPNRGKPLVSVCRVLPAVIDGREVPLPASIKETAPSDRDRCMVEACYVARDRANHSAMDGAAARQLFRDLWPTLTGSAAARRDVLRQAIEAARQRGLAAADVEDISEGLGLGVAIHG